MVKGRLFLIPVTLGSSDYGYVIPEKVLTIIRNLRVFIVEDVRSARRFLRMIDPHFPIDDSIFNIINKHTSAEDIGKMLTYSKDGSDTGLMSEAGIPVVADPGANLVLKAHECGIRVIPLCGPSSILLALMSSGLSSAGD